VSNVEINRNFEITLWSTGGVHDYLEVYRITTNISGAYPLSTLLSDTEIIYFEYLSLPWRYSREKIVIRSSINSWFRNPSQKINRIIAQILYSFCIDGAIFICLMLQASKTRQIYPKPVRRAGPFIPYFLEWPAREIVWWSRCMACPRNPKRAEGWRPWRSPNFMNSCHESWQERAAGPNAASEITFKWSLLLSQFSRAKVVIWSGRIV
jgi:hypothetical protein